MIWLQKVLMNLTGCLLRVLNTGFCYGRIMQMRGLLKDLLKLDLLIAIRTKVYNEKKEVKNRVLDFIRNTSVSPDEMNSMLDDLSSAGLRQKVKLFDVLLRPEVTNIRIGYEGIAECSGC